MLLRGHQFVLVINLQNQSATNHHQVEIQDDLK